RLSGAGMLLYTRPARSKSEPWQGHRKPPGQSAPMPLSAPILNFSDGEQPRGVQMPTATRNSGLIDRCLFLAYSGCCGLSDAGSLTLSSVLSSDASISGVRRRIHTGLPRHSTVIISPGASLLTSASTGAPAALARSDGVRLATNGTAVATAATPPAADVASSRVRRLLSIF